MKKLYKTLALSIAFFSVGMMTQAQNLPDVGSFGLRASFFSQNTIQAPYMLNENLSIAPTIGFSFGENMPTVIQVGVGSRFYQQSAGSLLPYISGNLMGVFIEDNANVMLSGGYGGEYFFSNDFSISAEGLINLSAGNGTALSTAASVSASIYF